MFRSTAQHKRYWRDRKINWQTQYLDTWTHPHRELIMAALKSLNWVSLWEVGCGPGPNLVRILHTFKDQPRQLGGSDINPDAIELARTTFKGGKFHVESTEDMMLSDNSVDIVLSDASLIYVSPLKIRGVVKEITRIARNHIVFCEFNSTSLWERWLLRWRTGYNAYNYQRLLEEAGCYDIKIIKIPPEFWDGYPWQPYGHIIIANVTKV